MSLFITLTPELAMALRHAAERRRSVQDGGSRISGRRVQCGCEVIYPLEQGHCPACAAPVEHSAPLYATLRLPVVRQELVS